MTKLINKTLQNRPVAKIAGAIQRFITKYFRSLSYQIIKKTVFGLCFVYWFFKDPTISIFLIFFTYHLLVAYFEPMDILVSLGIAAKKAKQKLVWVGAYEKDEFINGYKTKTYGTELNGVGVWYHTTSLGVVELHTTQNTDVIFIPPHEVCNMTNNILNNN